jgi:hypothetical protein
MSPGDIIDKNRDYPKVSKATSGYLEIANFVKADLNAGYFCNNCVYFLKESNACVIVKNSGPDVDGGESGIIAPHGVCTLWFPNDQAS